MSVTGPISTSSKCFLGAASVFKIVDSVNLFSERIAAHGHATCSAAESSAGAGGGGRLRDTSCAPGTSCYRATALTKASAAIRLKYISTKGFSPRSSSRQSLLPFSARYLSSSPKYLTVTSHQKDGTDYDTEYDDKDESNIQRPELRTKGAVDACCETTPETVIPPASAREAPILWYPKREPGRIPQHVTFYKRQLPAPCVPFSSEEGKKLWVEALQNGTADCYFKLSEQFITQSEPAYCGLTTLAMVLNTLGIDPRRTWKGVWRWYVEDMLGCCTLLSDVAENGTTFREIADLARCNGAAVELMPYESLSLEAFRRVVASSCAQSEKFLVVAYSRSELNQSGDGHFSPIGGYNEHSDMVLILDVARFKYPPHWVPLPRLHKAMSHTDSQTGRPRGAMLLWRHPSVRSVLFSLNENPSAWRAGHRFISEELPALAAMRVAAEAKRGQGSCGLAFSLPRLLSSLAAELPAAATDSIVLRRQPGCSVPGPHPACSRHDSAEQLLLELRAMPLCKAMLEEVGATADLKAERLVMLLLMAPPSTWSLIPRQYRAAVLEMLNPSSGRWALTVTAAEVDFLRSQLQGMLSADAEGSLE